MNQPILRWATLLKFSAASLFCLLISACATTSSSSTSSGSSTPSVNTQTEPGLNYSQYKTFAMLPLAKESPASDPGLMARISEPAHAAVVQALAAKGLKEADMAAADLAVTLHGRSVPKVQTTDWGYKSGPNYGKRQVMSAERDIEVEHYDERTLTIEIFDNHTKQQVWSGAKSANTTGKLEAAKLQDAIRSVLASFPAGSKP